MSLCTGVCPVSPGRPAAGRAAHPRQPGRVQDHGRQGVRRQARHRELAQQRRVASDSYVLLRFFV